MKKEFIPYEQALELKDLGFDEPCFGFYDAYNGSSHLLLNDRYEPLWLIRTWQRLFSKKYQDTTFISQSYVEYINGVCLAPIFSQVFRWFKEKYGIFSSTWCFETEHKFFIEFGFGIQKFEVADKENTELACLKKLIEIAKNK